MIWYFLGGMIAGAVGWNMLIVRIGRKIERERQMEAFRRHDKDE